ncbi:MAG: DUF6512 family protein [Promethearchaeota archaeon]|jgi:hypothetical protein
MIFENKNYIFIKSAIYLAVFLLLHYLFKWIPNTIVSLFSAIDESVYQHMKIAFLAYIILMSLELTLFRKKITNKSNFIYSHLLSAVLIPFFTLVLFLIGAMFYGERHFVIEIIYAIIITYLSGLSINILEKEFYKVQFSKRFKIFIMIIIIIMVIEFIVFSFRLPWHDVFTNPYA